MSQGWCRPGREEVWLGSTLIQTIFVAEYPVSLPHSQDTLIPETHHEAGTFIGEYNLTHKNINDYMLLLVEMLPQNIQLPLFFKIYFKVKSLLKLNHFNLSLVLFWSINSEVIQCLKRSMIDKSV